MSFVFSKNKEKRSRSSTGESNSSFVKNVTSRVSGLLPAGITKWFSSPSSSGANGSAAIADGTDYSTEDEAPESPNSAQPLAKRLRYSSPVSEKYSQLTTSETTLTSNVVTETGSVLYQSIQSPPGRNTFRRETNFNSTPIRAQSEDLNTTTVIERNESSSYKQHTVSAIGQSIAQKRKSLFDSNKQAEQSLMACAKTAAHQSKDTKQPYFKPHLFGSPFYPGRTMYGGASSSSFISEPNIKHRKMTYVNESKDSDSVNMSSSSRRVMDLLVNYSSPLIDAKRIPRYEMSEMNDINRSLPVSSSNIRNSYKTQELYIPTTASIIRMKARSRLMDSTKAARQIIASHSSTLSPYPNYDVLKRHQSYDSGNDRSQSKLKTRLTRQNRGDDPFIMSETVELPTGVLQIDQNNLPKFSFQGSLATATVKSSGEAFKFSSPLSVCLEAKKTASPPPPTFDFGIPDKAAANTSPSKFPFGIQTKEITKTQTDKTEPIKSQEKSVITFAKASNDWKCTECWVSNKADAQKCVCCGAKQPTKQSASATNVATTKCTVCKLANTKASSDKCVNCEKMRSTLNTSNEPLSISNKSSSKWKCGDCWVDNLDSADKCICCGSRKPNKGNVPSAVVPVPKKVDSATVEKDWRCDDCLITNKASLDICAACGGAKPGTKPAVKTLPSIASTGFFNKPDNKLAEIVKSQKSNWECRVCLANNSEDKTSCVCCDADREDVKNSSAPKFKNFTFNAEANLGFKFGIDPKVQESNLAKMGDDGLKPKNTEESETNNNIVSKIPSYTFTLPSKKSDDKLDGSKTNEEPKPSFSFGIPKQNSSSFTSGFGSFKPPSPAKKLAEDREKSQEVPSISFKAPEAAKPGLFSSPTSNPQNAFLNNSTEKKSVSPKNKEPSVPETVKPQFSFSAVKPSVGGMFAPPVSATNCSFPTQDTQAQSAQPASGGMFAKTDATVPSPAVPFFSKPENSAPAPSLFSKPGSSDPAPSLFSKPESSATAPSLFSKPESSAPAPSLFSKPESSAPAPSLFSKPESSAPAPSLFSKPESSAPAPSLFSSNTPSSILAAVTTAAPVAAPVAAPAATTSTAPPMFSFGGNQTINTAPAPAAVSAPANDAKKFNFSFGSSTPTPAFGATPQNNSNTFSLSAANPLTNGPSNSLGGTGITSNPLASGINNSMGGTGTNGLASSGNGILGSTPMFNTVATESTTSMWPSTAEQTNQSNPFMSSATAKPTFSFGATPSPSPFGTPAGNSAPAPLVFGATPQPAQNLFGMNQNNTSQSSMFSTPAATQQPSPMFGNSQPSNPAPSMGMFGAPSPSPFGASSPAMPTFETSSMAPAPAPAFNFGAPQAPVFGFGQQASAMQPAMQQMQAGGVAGGFKFGAAPPAAPAQMQFSMGSAPSAAAAGRRVRKAVRRNPQR